MVFHLSRRVVHTVRHRLAASLVGTQRIPLALLAADYVYFGALRHPHALVSVVMSLRRGSTLVAFAGGLLLFGERNNWQKIAAVLGILAGIVLTVTG